VTPSALLQAHLRRAFKDLGEKLPDTSIIYDFRTKNKGNIKGM